MTREEYINIINNYYINSKISVEVFYNFYREKYNNLDINQFTQLFSIWTQTNNNIENFFSVNNIKFEVMLILKNEKIIKIV